MRTLGNSYYEKWKKKFGSFRQVFSINYFNYHDILSSVKRGNNGRNLYYFSDNWELMIFLIVLRYFESKNKKYSHQNYQLYFRIHKYRKVEMGLFGAESVCRYFFSRFYVCLASLISIPVYNVIYGCNGIALEIPWNYIDLKCNYCRAISFSTNSITTPTCARCECGLLQEGIFSRKTSSIPSKSKLLVLKFTMILRIFQKNQSA